MSQFFRVFTDQHEPRERRYQVLNIDLEAFLSLFVPGAENVWFRCSEGLPEGTRVTGFDYDPITRRLRVAVEHESFDPIGEGWTVPNASVSFMSLFEPLPEPKPEGESEEEAGL